MRLWNSLRLAVSRTQWSPRWCLGDLGRPGASWVPGTSRCLMLALIFCPRAKFYLKRPERRDWRMYIKRSKMMRCTLEHHRLALAWVQLLLPCLPSPWFRISLELKSRQWIEIPSKGGKKEKVVGTKWTPLGSQVGDEQLPRPSLHQWSDRSSRPKVAQAEWQRFQVMTKNGRYICLTIFTHEGSTKDIQTGKVQMKIHLEKGYAGKREGHLKYMECCWFWREGWCQGCA